MLYRGGLKFGSLDVDCNPCIVKGKYFVKDNVLIVTEGLIIYKDVTDIVIVTKDHVIRIPQTAFEYILTRNEEMSVISV